MRQSLVISCPASSRSGYGDHSRDLIRSLIAMDRFNIQIMDQRWGNCPRNALKKDDIINKLILPRGPLQVQPDIWIQVTVPNEFQRIGKSYNIGITAGIETDRVAAEWLEGMNRMDLNIVPSHHSKLVFEQTSYEKKDEQGNIVTKLKLQKPIHVLFEGLDISVFDKTDDIPSLKGIDDIKEDFCFLVCGHWLQGDMTHDRKDIGGTLQTFLHTFRSIRKKPALIIKTSSATFSVPDREDMLKRIQAIKSMTGIHPKDMPKIYLLHGNLTPEEMNGLYNHPKVKAMVSLTHGEGFGRPLLEFSVTGKPVIATDWSGHVDFLPNNFTFKVPGELKEVHPSAVQKGVILENSKWFYANYGYASALMKDMHKKYKTFITSSRKQRKYVKDNFSLDAMTEEFKNIIDDNIPKPVELNLPKLKLPSFPKLENANG